MFCGPNIYHLNRRFHGDNPIDSQRSDKDLPLLTWINSLPFFEAILKNTPPNHIWSQNGKFWEYLVETSLRRSADNKSFLVNLSCKWTPISLQGEHFLTTIFWIPDESTLQVRIRVIENLLAVILIPITIQTEEFAILSVTKKISKKLDKGEKQSLDLLLNFIHTNLGALHEVSQINLLHALADLYDN